MDRIVKRVNGVVRRARMVRVGTEDLEGDRNGLHLQPERLIPQCSRRGQQGDRIERGHLRIIRVAVMQAPHGLHVGNAAVIVITVTPEGFHRLEKTLLTVGWCLSQPFLARGTQTAQDGSGVVVIWRDREQRVVVAQRLAPIRHREIRIKPLRGLELLDRLVPTKAVQDRNTPQEKLLCLRRSGRRELKRPDLRRLCVGGGGTTPG